MVNGNDTLENPAGIFTRYGYLDDSTLQTDGQPTKTEPDQNTYLVTRGSPGGPTAGYDYGHHFLIQGHEVFTPSGATYNRAYFTRVNLDVTDPRAPRHAAQPAGGRRDGQRRALDRRLDVRPVHRPVAVHGRGRQPGRRLRTGAEVERDDGAPVANYDGSMGKAGYEGIHNDKLGNLILIEDVGGGNVTSERRQAAQLVRVPLRADHAGDLTKGKLQVLQISVNGTPGHLPQHDDRRRAPAALDDAMGADILAILRPSSRPSGSPSTTRPSTARRRSTRTPRPRPAGVGANANAGNKGTPLKRPENAKFVPGTDFRSFVVAETGDTSKPAGDEPGAGARGAWGALLRIDHAQGRRRHARRSRRSSSATRHTRRSTTSPSSTSARCC